MSLSDAPSKNNTKVLWSTLNMQIASSQLYKLCQNDAKHSRHFVRTANDIYETEFTLEGEPGLPDKYRNCPKNQSHENFIPIGSLELSHFQEKYRCPSILALTKRLSDVTVWLTLKKVSFKRPLEFPGTDFRYPFGAGKHNGLHRYGSGRIRFVQKSPYYDNKTCPCHECEDDPKKDWWMVGVVTATHVVFNQEEAVETTCRVGYDSEDSKFITLDGYGIASRGAFIEEDRSNLLFCTHDPAVAYKLTKYVADYKNIAESVVREFSDFPEEEKRLTIIVSHPHGYPKRVTIGEWLKKKKDYNGFTLYMYNAATCPGTSGAPVYVLDRKNLPYCNHPHSAAAKDGFNYCGGGYGSETITHP